MAGLGVFLVHSERFLMVQKFIYLNFRVKFLNFGTTYLSLGAIYLNFGAIYLNFGTKIRNECLSEGEWGGMGGSLRTSGRFRHRCREKEFRLPLIFGDDQITVKNFFFGGSILLPMSKMPCAKAAP